MAHPTWTTINNVDIYGSVRGCKTIFLELYDFSESHLLINTSLTVKILYKIGFVETTHEREFTSEP